MYIYKARGNKIVLVDSNGDESDSATVDRTLDAEFVAKLLNKAAYLNDVKRQYTASARLFAQAERIDGFRWIVPNN